MAKREDYEKKTEALIQPILDELGFYLWDVEYVKEGADFYLRCYIDKEGGINIGDCETVSRRMNDLLDAEDYIKDPFIFEVSSPGLGRTLKKDKEFARCIGKEVDLKLYKAIEKQKEFNGILAAFDDSTFTIRIGEEDTVFERANVSKISLAFDF